jgi:hypothetical protein
MCAAVAAVGLWVGAATSARAQGVTTSSVSGMVVGTDGVPLPGALIRAVHAPSGTAYEALTRQDGRFAIPGMRVGGPYLVTAALIGYQRTTQEGVYLTLGVTSNLRFEMQQTAVQVEGITITAERDPVFSAERTGAATEVRREIIDALPSFSRRIEDFARLTPQYSAGPFGFSFAGQDNRLNNMTVDGSYFNNSFGLAGQPGDRTGVAPISLDAIEQVQVNIAPYDVRQGNFVGAGVNMVTRSGANNYFGTLYYQVRNDDLVGRQAGSNRFDPGTFDFSQFGASLGGPIIRNRLFFFVNYEHEGTTQPGTTFRANAGGETVGGNVTRVLRSDLDALSTFLSTNFNYETGGYEGYDHETPGTRFLARLDYNLSTRSKLSLRYSVLNSETDVLLSNSGSLGFGGRRSNTTGLNFQNSNYIILENIRSIVGEWNTQLGGNFNNSLIVGYTSHDESRKSRGQFFPMVDILEGGSVYTTIGFEPFTPNNELRYNSFQVQNNLSYYRRNHTVTVGVSFERYESENVFFPGSQSVYVYNSLADFYADANDYLANPNRTVSPVTLNRFQVRWSNIPGQIKPIQPLEVTYMGLYAQDEWQVSPTVRVTAGVRLDVPRFGDTGFHNADVDTMTFRDADGNPVQFRTDRLPGANLLISPRLGFNADVGGNRRTQLRGGTGLFAGRPAYVWISNQIGQNGILTGFESISNTTARPFHPDPNHYKPTTVTGAPASSYALDLTDHDFRFPQLWRSNLAVDQRLPWGLVGTAEFIYNRDVNGISYIDANQPTPDANFTGPDRRPRWTVDYCPTISGRQSRLNCTVTNAIVLQNQNQGRSWNIAFSLERPFRSGLFGKLAYSYGESENTVDPGSIAFGSWNANPHAGLGNNPGLGFSANSPGHRLFTALSYARDFFGVGETSVSLYWEGRTGGNASYLLSGDLNGDGGTFNDLIYIARDTSEMNFETFTSGGVTFTRQQQQQAWEAFIQQDEYLREHRGQYAQRGAIFLPMVYRADLSIAQNFRRTIFGSDNRLQVRLDIFNFSNLINRDWGVGQRFVTTSPLIARGADGTGAALYRLRNIGPNLISQSFERTAGPGDVWRIQLGVRYSFN